MTSSASRRAPAERILLAAGTASYDHGAYPALDRVPEVLADVVATLRDLGFSSISEATPGYRVDQDVRSLRADIRKAAAAAPYVVVYYTGHGIQQDGGTYYLVGKRSDPGRLAESALSARELLELLTLRDLKTGALLEDARQPTVLVILDCCFSGAAATELLRDALNFVGNPSVWVLASAGPLEYARQGAFAKAFCDALRRPTTGPSQQHLSLDTIMQAIRHSRIGAPGQEAVLFPPRGRLSGIPQFFPNPYYHPGLGGLTVDDQQHWLSRVRGGPEESTTGFYLTGRTGRRRATKRLAAWMTLPGTNGLAVITGSPGAGKSALLALPVLLANQSRRADLLRVAEPDSLIRHVAGQFDASAPVIAVHARGLNADQVAGRIARSLGRGDQTVSALLEDLESVPGDDHVIVVDAIDEAVSPATLLSSLLIPLARHPGMRVAAGSRPHVVAGIAQADLVIDLDAEDYQDPQALRDYARRLLTAAEEPGVKTAFTVDGMAGQAAPGARGDRGDIATAVAEAIARRSTAGGGERGSESFFIARLLALATRSRSEPPDLTHDEWQSQLPASVSAAFDEDLARLGSMEPKARTLLTALAWAKGSGLPWENIWVPVARSLAKAAGTGQPEISDEDVRWLLRKAGAYIVEDTGPGGRSVYRPFHDVLAAHLRGERGYDEADPDGQERDRPEGARRHIERAIFRTLLDTLPTDSGRRNWASAHPYLRTYLAQHAAAAGPTALQALTADADFLAVAEPATLSPLLLFVPPRLRGTARIYRRARPLLGDDPEANAAYLQEATRVLAPTSEVSGRIRPAYRTRFATARVDDSLCALLPRSAPAALSFVKSVAFVTAQDGRMLAAAGMFNGTVCVWDVQAGTLAGQPYAVAVPDNDDGGATPVAFGTTADARLLLAAGGGDGTVHVWDMATGAAARTFKAGVETESVAFGTTEDGRLLLAAASGNRALVWNVVTGARIGREITLNDHLVLHVAFGNAADGSLLLAVSHWGGQVSVWNPLAGAQVGGNFGGRVHMPHAALGAGPDGRLLLAAEDNDFDAGVSIWDVALGKPHGKHCPTDEWVETPAFGVRQDGRLLLAAGELEESKVQVWNVEPRRRIRVLAGHTSSVNSVAFAAGPDGRPLLASGSTDGTVRVWDVTSDVSARQERSVADRGPAPEVALDVRPDGRVVLATGGNGATVRLWDAVTGTLKRELTLKHDVSDLVLGSGPDGRPSLAVVFWTPHGVSEGARTVLVFDADTGELVSTLPSAPGEGPGPMVIGAPSGRLLAVHGRFERTAQVWDPVTRQPASEPLTSLRSKPDHLALGMSVSGHVLLAASAYSYTQVWDMSTGTLAAGGLPSGARSLATGTTLDGRPLLAVGGTAHPTARVTIWDMTTGRAVGKPLEGHDDDVRAIAFGTGRNGRRLIATGGSDRTVRIWDLRTGACQITLRRREEPVSLALAGGLLAIGDYEGFSVIELPDGTRPGALSLALPSGAVRRLQAPSGAAHGGVRRRGRPGTVRTTGPWASARSCSR